MLPVWAIIGPTVTLGITKYLFSVIVQGVTTKLMRYRLSSTENLRGAKSKDITTTNENIEIYSKLIAVIISETAFYPFETIIHRIQLQGTRTIIDNLDSGFSVVPILTSYEGAIDCYNTTLATEGVSGLYKGFGSMVLQFASHIAVIKITKWIFTQITEVFTNKPSKDVKDYYQGFEGYQQDVDKQSITSPTVGSITFSRSLSNISVSLCFFI